MIQNYQKNLGILKSAMEDQNLYGKESEYGVVTIQTVSVVFEIATWKKDNLLNKRTEIFNTCEHRSKCKLVNCETTDWRQIHIIKYHYNPLL